MTTDETERHRLDEDMRAVLATPQGRRVLWRVIEEMAGSHGANPHTDEGPMNRREGMRDVGLALVHETQRVAPLLYVQMMAEELERRIHAQKKRALERETAEE